MNRCGPLALESSELGAMTTVANLGSIKRGTILQEYHLDLATIVVFVFANRSRVSRSPGSELEPPSPARGPAGSSAGHSKVYGG